VEKLSRKARYYSPAREKHVVGEIEKRSNAWAAGLAGSGMS